MTKSTTSNISNKKASRDESSEGQQPNYSTQPTNTNELRKELAAIEHDRWSDWQLWCHEVIRSNVGKIDELEKVLARWGKQAVTPYEKLSDKEQASDMEQVDRYWHLIEDYITDQQRQLLDRLLEKTEVYPEKGIGSITPVRAVPVQVIKDIREGLNALTGGSDDQNN